MQDLEMYSIPVISLSHIDEETAGILGSAPFATDFFGSGFILLIFTAPEFPIAPLCIQNIWEWARKNRYYGQVMLDQDARVVEGLPTYDW